MDFKKSLLFASLFAASAVANATVSISGSSLQDALNAEAGGVSGINVATDQYNPDETWGVNPSTPGSTSYVFSNWASDTSLGIWDFGIYDINNTANRVQLDHSSTFTGDVTFSFYDVGDGQNSVILNNTTDTTVDFTTQQFGFYLQLDNNSGTSYSQDFLNSGSDSDNSNDEMITFAGGAGNHWNAGQFIIAFDYLGGSGGDYDDYVAVIESINPVPEPSSLALLGLGLAGLGAARRKQTKA